MKQRHLVSKLLQPLEMSFAKGKNPKKATIEDTSAKSHRMLVDYGIIRQCHQGSYAYLPLALKSVKKLENLIDFHMDGIHAQKVLLPTMTDGKLWKKSGRWQLIQDELFTLKNNEHTMTPQTGTTFGTIDHSKGTKCGTMMWGWS